MPAFRLAALRTKAHRAMTTAIRAAMMSGETTETVSKDTSVAPSTTGRDGAASIELAMELITGATQAAPSPRAMQATVRMTMAMVMGAGTSWACSAASERGRARNVTPKAFTKQVTARAPVMARATTAKAKTMRMKMPPSMAAPMSPW